MDAQQYINEMLAEEAPGAGCLPTDRLHEVAQIFGEMETRDEQLAALAWLNSYFRGE